MTVFEREPVSGEVVREVRTLFSEIRCDGVEPPERVEGPDSYYYFGTPRQTAQLTILIAECVAENAREQHSGWNPSSREPLILTMIMSALFATT